MGVRHAAAARPVRRRARPRPRGPASRAGRASPEAAAHGRRRRCSRGSAGRTAAGCAAALGPGNRGHSRGSAELLRAAGRPLPGRVAVYAAEADPAALLAGERALQRAGTACGLPVRFHALPLHGCALPAAWPAELSAGSGTLLAYAACGLPGAGPSGFTPQAEQLAAVGALRPRALVLSAPDADFAAGGPLGRFEAAWPYYEALFRWLGDRLLPAGVRSGLHARYGAGLASVLGEAASPDGAQASRALFVRTAEWIRRLQAAGYRPAPIPPGAGLGSPAADGLRVEPHPWHYGLSYAGVNLQSVLCAIPAS
ncbi:hypothetical protein PM3016_317 [Paenibacillus mucilaginosus 3016]|uniref:Uncharacterized protein n=2 Tax=Paenibacillus mucilaginosus TaxID=61624 RepID=H6NRL1_9BACL|nr:hypothetical protein PM3016_317 [Paenibacillus mucilaginosus 3016]